MRKLLPVARQSQQEAGTLRWLPGIQEIKKPWNYFDGFQKEKVTT
jgi:hypothetical protein